MGYNFYHINTSSSFVVQTWASSNSSSVTSRKIKALKNNIIRVPNCFSTLCHLVVNCSCSCGTENARTTPDSAGSRFMISDGASRKSRYGGDNDNDSSKSATCHRCSNKTTLLTTHVRKSNANNMYTAALSLSKHSLTSTNALFLYFYLFKECSARAFFRQKATNGEVDLGRTPYLFEFDRKL